MSLENDTPSADATEAVEALDATEATEVAETTTPEAEPLDVLPSGDAAATDDFEAQLAMKNLEKRRAEKKRKKRLTLAAIVAAIAAVIGLVLFLNSNKEDDPDDEYVPETAIVERRDFSNVITSSGSLRAGSTEVVTPEVDGIIESVMVTEGDTVSKGDVLLTIKNEELDKAIHEAEQGITEAQQGVSSAQSAVTQAVAARNEAWDRYNSAYAAANRAHNEWASLKKNYKSLHAAWKKRNAAAQKLKVAKPEVEPKEPANPGDPGNKPYEFEYTSGKTGEELDAAKEQYEADLEAWEQADEAYKTYQKDFADYQKAYQRYLKDVDAYHKYQEALAKVGDEPTPAGEEPEYPEKPSEADLQAAITDAEEGVATAQQAVTKATEAYDEAVKAGEKRTVKAPSNGRIMSVSAKVGASTLGSGGEGVGGDALITISDVKKMAVDVEVNEIDILSIEKGQKATVTFSAVPDLELEAYINEVASTASGEGGDGGSIVTFRVGLVIPKPDKRLRAGMTATVNIITADATDVLVIPASALSEGEDGFSVEVVTDEKAMETETRDVTLGERGSSEVVITEGLEEGEVILLSGGMDDEFLDEEEL